MQQRLRQLSIAPGYEQLRDFVVALHERFDLEGEVLHDGRNTLRAYTVDGAELVVKRFKRPNLVQRIAYTFFEPSKAERAYRFAGELRSRGVDTPHEVAFLELQRGPLLQDSYFVCLRSGDESLFHVLQRPDFDRDLATQLGDYLARLHEKGVLHGDLNLGNILHRPADGGRYHFSLIDTNRSHFHQPTRRECLDNLRRMTYDRPLMAFVVAAYARARGWDAEATVEEELRLLHRFWMKHHRRNQVKRFFGKKV